MENEIKDLFGKMGIVDKVSLVRELVDIVGNECQQISDHLMESGSEKSFYEYKENVRKVWFWVYKVRIGLENMKKNIEKNFVIKN